MPIRILIADDHDVFRSGLKALLDQEPDLEVVSEADDGYEAIQAVRDSEVDVVLLDLSMPRLTGDQVASTLLKDNPNLAIVVLTMHQERRYLQQLLKIGARGFVLKKSPSTDLLQAIRAAHEGRRYVDPSFAGEVLSSFLRGEAAAEPTGGPTLLTRREKDVLILLAQGYTNTETAGRLGISTRTVETHRINIKTKLNLSSRAELVRFAIDNELLKLE